MHQTVKQRIIRLQLQQNALLIDRHQVLRRILPRKMKTLDDLDCHFGIRKKLTGNCLLQLKDAGFHNQLVTLQINAHKIAIPIHRNPVNTGKFQNTFKLLTQLQRRKHFHKRLFQSIDSCSIISHSSSSKALPAKSEAALPPAASGRPRPS